jgi:hypothetical protein
MGRDPDIADVRQSRQFLHHAYEVTE